MKKKNKTFSSAPSPRKSVARLFLSKTPPPSCRSILYKLFWIFFIGCILGVFIETVWFLIVHHKYITRSGLIYGPFNLVYGFGALVITLGLYQFSQKHGLILFLMGGIIGSVFEYLCSYFQEVVFETSSWEYSKMIFNLHGRINLLYSIFWGILALLWIKILLPQISRLIEKIPYHLGYPLAWSLFFFMTFNIAISACAVKRQTERYHLIPAQNSFQEFLDEHYPDHYLQKIYPDMEFKIK